VNWRPWVTPTSATTPKENRIGSMPVCRLRLSITILGDLVWTVRTILRPGPFPSLGRDGWCTFIRAAYESALHLLSYSLILRVCSSVSAPVNWNRTREGSERSRS